MGKINFNRFLRLFPGKLFVLLFLVLFFSQCTILTEIKQLSKLQKSEYFINPDTSGAKLEYVGNYPVVHLYGSPEEMGRQYGTLLKPQLNSLYSIISSVFPHRKLNEFLQQAKSTEPFLPDEVRTELKAISETSKLDYLFIVAMNVVPRVDCSTLAAWGESTASHNLIMGRNSEYYTKGLNKVLGLIVVRHPDNGFQTINITFLGMVGTFTGMNEKGVCYGNMLAYNGWNDSIYIGGLPVQLLMRIGGERASNPEEFKEFLFQNKHIIPIIVMVAGTDKAFVTEHTQDKSDFREATRSVLASANFFQTPKITKVYEPDERYAILLNEVRKNYGKLDVGLFEKIMEKASQKDKNVQCVIFEPREMKLYISINKVPASEGPFSTIDANQLFGK
jgi:isopenicillin-N N-acyltransferase like protein